LVATVPGVLPPATEFVAPAAWRSIEFISDLHLCDALPRTFEAWAAYMRDTPADAVFILGDLFEFWHGSDAAQLTFEQGCMQVLADAARRRYVALMVGNRDFLVTPSLLQSVGVQALADPTLLRAWQQALLLTHGDALCLADAAYQQFRAWTRNPATQRDFLARPLAERLKLSAGIRHASEAGRHQAPPVGGWADLDTDAAVSCMQSAGAVQMVHGHTHRPGNSTLAPGYRRLVLSDWDLDSAVPRAEVLRWGRNGFRRRQPRHAGART
jgi:UDP-2,3-diacylglucosamine hydrolase